jgi:hypothetical protein
MARTERFSSVVRIEQVDPDGQVHLVGLPTDDPTAVELLRSREPLRPDRADDVPTMYHSDGKQRGTTGTCQPV